MKSGLTLGHKALIGGSVTAVFLGVMLLAGHDAGRAPPIRFTAPPLELWSAQALDAKDLPRGEAIQVCTDPMVRQGFGLPLPRFNGEPCLMISAPQERGASFNARCTAGQQQYGVNIVRIGDQQSDFTVRMRARPLGLNDPGVLHVVRYRKLGPCPTGAIAGQATKGGRTFDALDTRM